MFFSSFCSFIVFKVSGRCYRLYRWRSGFVTHPTCFLYTFLLLVINYHLSILCFSFLYFVHVMNREYYRLRGLFNGWSFVPFFFGTRVICNLVSPVAFVLLFFFFLIVVYVYIVFSCQMFFFLLIIHNMSTFTEFFNRFCCVFKQSVSCTVLCTP